MQKRISTLVGILVIVIIAVTFFGGVFVYQYLLGYKTNNQQQGLTACTEEAKICPDGSVVGRTGPNCEFAECPEVKVDKTCRTECIKKGYSDGNCTEWEDWESPESRCSSLGAEFLSGKFSDCEVMENAPKGVVEDGVTVEIVGAGGVICCCK